MDKYNLLKLRSFNVGFEDIPYEKRKGTTDRKKNKEWPQNYFKAILDAQERYKIVLTSMHWDLLNFFENNSIEYYLAFPSLDSEKILNIEKNEYLEDVLKKENLL